MANGEKINATFRRRKILKVIEKLATLLSELRMLR